MRTPGWKTAIVSTAIATLLLTSCASSADDDRVPQNAGGGDAVAPAEAASAIDVTDINVCAWARTEAIMPTVQFGTLDSQEVAIHAEQRALGLADGSTQLSCDIGGQNSSTMTFPGVVGTVTLMSGGPEVDADDSFGEPYSYRDIEGFSIIDDSVARVVVQLDPTTTLSVEGFNPGSASDYGTIGRLGVMPLMSRMLDAWVADMVPTTVEGSFADASDFCADTDITGWEERLSLPEGDVVAPLAQGVRKLWSENGDVGSITCGLRSYSGSDQDDDSWPWNEPSTFGHPGVSVSLTNFPDDSAAAQYTTDHTSSNPTDCSSVVATGSPAYACSDGSGMASRRGVSGAWASLADVDAELSDPESLASALDATAEAMLAQAVARSAAADVDVDDPRDAPIDISDTPPAEAACEDGQDVSGYQTTPSAEVSFCIDGNAGMVVTTGSIDGVPFTLTDTCGEIDATSWGGPSTAFVCVDYHSISVTAGQETTTTYFREFFAEKWGNSAYQGGLD